MPKATQKRSENLTAVDEKKRSENFSADEKKLLSELVLKWQQVVENKKTDATTNQQKQVGWQKLATEFNMLSGHYFRTPDSPRTCWENIKRISKKASTERKSEFFKTGGGVPPPAPPATPMDKIVETILGPVLKGLENKFDGDRLVMVSETDKENWKQSDNIIIDTQEIEYASDFEITSEQDCEIINRAPKNDEPNAGTSSQINKENETWQNWTSKLLEKPINKALQQTDSGLLKTRRPNTECLSDQLLRKKQELVEALIENANREAHLKCLILDEQLKQERLKTEMLEKEANK